MINISLVNNIIIALINAFGILLALWVYSADRKEKVNIGLSLMIITILSWITFYHIASLSTQHDLSLIFFKISGGSVFIFFIAYYYFIIRWFLGKTGIYKFLDKLVLLYGFIFALLTIFTNFIITDSRFENWGAFPVFSPFGWFVFYGYVIFLTVLIITTLLTDYFKSSEEKKLKIQYFLTGVFLFTGLNFAFNVVSQILFQDYRFYQLGNYSTVFLIGYTTMAIIRKELFGIKVALAQILVGVIAVLLFIDVVVSETLFEYIWKGALFVTFLYFGYLLIKSVLREIEMREKVKRAYDIEKRARKEIEEITEAKTQFIMATQHHLRTPLTSMIGYLDLMFGGTYGKVPAKLKEALQRFQVSTKRLIRVVNELLDISQFQMGREVVTLVPNTNIEPIIKEVLEELQFEVKMRGLYLKYNKVGEPPAVKADSEKLKVALFNIVDNAIKYTKKGGIIVILQKAKKGIQISVKDTGMGLESEKAKKLFDSAFVRGKEAKKVHGFGRGIGIYVSGHIIKAHNGKIWAESEGKGKGTTFFIELPVK